LTNSSRSEVILKRSALIRTTLATTLLLSVALVADAKLARTGTPSVLFRASGPAGMKIQGTTSDLDVDDQGAKIVIKVPLKNLTTGIALRDDHMRNKYLQVGTYPNAELTVDRSTLRLPTGDGNTSGDASGTMAIHGKTKNVTFHYTVAKSAGTLHVGGTTKLDIKDYGIDVPSYLGVTVKPDIDVEVQFNATE
jgi:polyisoprenoid-binding protein YceI